MFESVDQSLSNVENAEGTDNSFNANQSIEIQTPFQSDSTQNSISNKPSLETHPDSGPEAGNSVVPFLVEILSKGNVDCYGESTGYIHVIGKYGIGNITYQWSNGQSGKKLKNLRAGSYTVTATDSQMRNC